MKKVVLLVLSLVLVLSFGLVGCAPAAEEAAPAVEEAAPVEEAPAEEAPAEEAAPAEEEAPAEEAAGEEPVMIGVLFKTLANPYWVGMQEGVIEGVKDLPGVEIEILAAESEEDISGQLSIMETMISSGKYDALAVAPITPTNLISGVVQANAAGLPVVNIDEMFDMAALEEAGGHVVGFATTDNFGLGEDGAELIIDALGTEGGGVAIIEGQAGATSGELRRDGCVAGLEGAENIEVLEIQPGDWDRQKSLDVATNLINKYGDELNAIFTANDTMALGILQAMENTGRDDIFLVSTDANDEVRAGIAEGKLVAVVQDSGALGTICVEMAANAAREGKVGAPGEEVEEHLIQATVVTQDNVVV